MKYIYGTKGYPYLIFGVFLMTLSPNLKKTSQFFQVSIHFNPLHSKNSFSALQWSLATKLHHYCLVFVDARTSFSVLKSLTKIAWHCPFKTYQTLCFIMCASQAPSNPYQLSKGRTLDFSVWKVARSKPD